MHCYAIRVGPICASRFPGAKYMASVCANQTALITRVKRLGAKAAATRYVVIELISQ